MPPLRVRKTSGSVWLKVIVDTVKVVKKDNIQTKPEILFKTYVFITLYEASVRGYFI